MLALLLVAIIAGCAYGFNYLASNAAYLVAQDGKVAVYQAFPETSSGCHSITSTA